jgi:hypothetical protein
VTANRTTDAVVVNEDATIVEVGRYNVSGGGSECRYRIKRF